MFGFSGEHLLVLLVILLIFGPRRLPDLGHSIGRTLKNFKDGMGGLGTPESSAQNTSQQIEKQATPKPSEQTQEQEQPAEKT